jgi:hypothetical protein
MVYVVFKCLISVILPSVVELWIALYNEPKSILLVDHFNRFPCDAYWEEEKNLGGKIVAANWDGVLTW